MYKNVSYFNLKRVSEYSKVKTNQQLMICFWGIWLVGIKIGMDCLVNGGKNVCVQ
jgi:hypothetical protein